ncbi:HAD family hydrolase [uncultured Schumannella sp.]|uniref:HAD family hydrolase n=1 Tax=uncultured Schumannella sp. TaxID=1195956 RepID=UPI0025F9ECDB|nr:HAD family hydrolase [uncultured Schumannella sp.]
MTPVELRVVLFDLDDTLFAHRRSVELGLHAHRATLGAAIAAAAPDLEFTRWNDLEERHYHRYLSGEIDFHEQRRARARGFLEPHGVILDDEAALAWFDAYLLEYERSWTRHDDVDACLTALADRHLGIITNGELAFQLAKLRAIGLEGAFEQFIASGELGVAKPDARIFERACELFEVEPSQAAYIGDRLHTDAIGAARAGLLGVWLDRPGIATAEQRAEAASAGVPVIRSLAELPALLP